MLPVVDKLLNIPVVQFKVPFIVPPNDVILPETSNLTDGVFPIPIRLLQIIFCVVKGP